MANFWRCSNTPYDKGDSIQMAMASSIIPIGGPAATTIPSRSTIRLVRGPVARPNACSPDSFMEPRCTLVDLHDAKLPIRLHQVCMWPIWGALHQSFHAHVAPGHLGSQLPSGQSTTPTKLAPVHCSGVLSCPAAKPAGCRILDSLWHGCCVYLFTAQLRI